MEHLKIASDAG